MAGYSIAAFLCYGLTFVLLQQFIGNRFRVQQLPRQDSWARLALLALHSPLLFVAVKTLVDQPVRLFPMLIGSGITVLGLYVSMWAQWTLGRNWVAGVALRKQHQLVTTGPFHYVRHPLYSGMLISTAGLGVFSLNVWFLLAILCFTGGFLLRVPAEEQMLRQKFKKRYESYATSTGMLVPKLQRKEG